MCSGGIFQSPEFGKVPEGSALIFGHPKIPLKHSVWE